MSPGNPATRETFKIHTAITENNLLKQNKG